MPEQKKAKVLSPSSLNIRKVPGGDILTEARHNAILTVLDWDSNGTWAKVQLGDTEGWAMKDYLEEITENDVEAIAIEETQKRNEEKEKQVGGMFANIGDKIKSVTAFFCVLGIICSVLAGLIMMLNHAVLPGLLTAVLGALFSYLGSMAMYGFGELICETKKQSAIQQELLKELRRR